MPFTGPVGSLTRGVWLAAVVMAGWAFVPAVAQAASSATMLRSWFSPAAAGQPVTFSAIVSGSTGGAPAGTVTFKNGGDALGNPSTVNTRGVGQPLTSSSTYSCAVTPSGGVKCWGDNAAPYDISGVADVVAVDGGIAHACVVTRSGSVKCWGSNLRGQLGRSGDGSMTPTDVSGISDAVAVAAGDYHTCALMASGLVSCWGWNVYYQLGHGGGVGQQVGFPDPFIVDGVSGVIAVAAAEHFTCALTAAGKVMCWGHNTSGQAGNWTGAMFENGISPITEVAGVDGVVAISAGGGHTCALTAAGTVKCWGANNAGQLGNSTYFGTGTPNPTPAEVAGLIGVVAIAAGGAHSCALSAAGNVICWGESYGGPGLIYVPGLGDVAAISAGLNHNCAVTVAGSPTCWGSSNASGQLNAPSGAGNTMVFGRATLVTSALDTGTHDITAEFDGDTHDDSSAGPLTQTIVIADQTIGFTSTAPASPTAGTTYTPVASATSGLAVSFGASGVCLFAGGQVTFTAPGTCTVTANQAGNTNYNPAPQVTQTITVIKTTPTVGLVASAGSSDIGQSATFTATISSDGVNTPTGTVTFEFDDGSQATVPLSSGSAAQAHSFAAGGSYAVAASYSGDSNYEAAAATTLTHTVRFNQTVSFTSTPPSPALVSKSYAAAAGASSGLPVTLGVSGACSYSGGVRFDTAGSCTVTAIQSGDATYAPAQATQAFSIVRSATDTTVISSLNPSVYGSPVTFTAKVVANAGTSPTGTVTFKDGNSAIGSPVPLNSIGFGQSIFAGGSHTCAQTGASGLQCWGLNRYGQLGETGLSWDTPNPTPVDVTGLGAFTAVAAGGSHNCVVTGADGVKCWGANHYGQLGNNTNTGSLTSDPNPIPADIAGLDGVTAVELGSAHSCALLASGGVKCWGYNTAGQLGTSTNNNTENANPVPADVPGLGGVIAIAAGSYHTCALIAGGTVKCWGSNQYGELGNANNTGTFSANPAPADVAGLSGVIAIAVGTQHTCALKEDHSVLCWGYNRFGQLGNATNNGVSAPNPVPAEVSGLGEVVSIALNGYHSCALTASGVVKCWGYNFDGQIGRSANVGTNVANPAPTDVAGLGGVVSVAAGGAHTCALLQTGAVRCWGRNSFGQLGNVANVGTNAATPAPVEVTSLTVDATVGAATLTTSSLTGGSHAITALYSGDAVYESSTSSALNQTVNKANQTLNFTSSATGAATGGTYTPAATASSALAASFGTSGACSFASGKVTFTAAGDCTVTADQPGNGNYNAATQATQTISVGKGATTASVRSSASPSTRGQQVTFTATIAIAGSNMKPAGMVTFKDGGRTIGTGALANGVARTSTAGLTIGNHTITAAYGGGADFEISTSPGIVQKVSAGKGPETKVNTRTTGAQDQPAIARLKNGYVIAWISAGQDRSGDGIYMQRYAATGAKAGDETLVNTTKTGDQSEPAIAGLDNGGFVVVWQSSDGSGMGIYGQRFTANGAKSGKEFKVNTTTQGHQSLPAVAALEDGGFVVTWVSNGQDGAGLGIYAQMFTATGKPEGDEFKVTKTTAGNQTAPAVTGLTNGFVIAWQGEDDSGWGIFMQRYNAAGRAMGTEVQVNKTEANDQMLPSVAPLPAGGFVIAWQSRLQDGSGLGTYLQRFNANGAKAGGELRINTTTASDQAAPAIAGFTDEGFVAVWQSRNQDGSGFGIVAQVFDSTGGKVNAEFVVNATTAGDQSQPAIAAFAGGNFTAAWTSTGQDGSATGIYAQRLQVPMGD